MKVMVEEPRYNLKQLTDELMNGDSRVMHLEAENVFWAQIWKKRGMRKRN